MLASFYGRLFDLRIIPPGSTGKPEVDRSQADFPLRIAVSRRQITSVWPTNQTQSRESTSKTFTFP